MSILNLLRSKAHNFNPTEQKIIDFVLANSQSASEMTIGQLSQHTGVSTATISRFVKKIGLNSFRDFALGLATLATKANNQDFFGEIADGDNQQAIIDKVFSGAKNALDMTLQQLSTVEFSMAVDWLISARRVGFFGIGGSSIVAFNAYHKFLRTPLAVISHPDYDVQLMQAVQFTKADVAVVISHSGRNNDTLLIAKKLREQGVKIIVITAFDNAPLTRLADMVLISMAEEVNFRSESMSSLIAQLTIIDTLFTLVGSKLADQTQTVVDAVRQTIEQTREKK